MNKYRLICKKGEGTFSEVLKAQSLKNQKYVAIKCMKNHFDSIDKVNNLREIQALRRLSPHPHVVKLHEVLYDQPTGRLALVFELMEMNIYELIRGRRHYLQKDRVKHFLYQLVKAMDHMHRNGIFHRDIKPENILISNEELKVADFGSCRGIYSKQPYTEYISTRWYRAPECLLTDGYYGYKMDMWGIGCVMFEVLALFPLFPGTNEVDQIARIHDILGTPPQAILDKFKKHATHMDFNFKTKKGTGIGKLIPHCSATCVDLIEKLLAYDPEQRMSARQALRHPYFAELRNQEKQQAKVSAAAAAAAEASSGTQKHSTNQSSPGKQANTILPTGNIANSSSRLLDNNTNKAMAQPSSSNEKGTRNSAALAPSKTTDNSTTQSESLTNDMKGLPVLMSGEVRTGSTKQISHQPISNHGSMNLPSNTTTTHSHVAKHNPYKQQSNHHSGKHKTNGHITYTKYRHDANLLKKNGVRKVPGHGRTTKSKYSQYTRQSHLGSHQSSSKTSTLPLPPIGHSETKSSKYLGGVKSIGSHNRRAHDNRQTHRNQSDVRHHHHHKSTKGMNYSHQSNSSALYFDKQGRTGGGAYGFGTRRGSASKSYQSPYSQNYLKSHVAGM